MVNISIRQVIRRSIYTSVFTLIPITALLIFGESTLSDFAFALLVGILAGAYSSIFIAPQVLSLFKAWRAGSVRRAPARPSGSPAALEGHLQDSAPRADIESQGLAVGCVGGHRDAPPPGLRPRTGTSPPTRSRRHGAGRAPPRTCSGVLRPLPALPSSPRRRQARGRRSGRSSERK